MAPPRAGSLATYAPLPPLRLPATTLATALGTLVYAACQWGLVVALARLGTPALVGQYAMGIAVSGPIMLLATLQLRAVQVTDATHENSFSEYLGLRLTTSSAAVVVIGGIALTLGGSWAGAAVILLVGASKAVESVSDVYRGSMQQAERMERVATSMILRGLCGLAGFSAALLSGGGLPLALIVVVATSALVWRAWDVPNAEPTTPGRRAWASGSEALFGVAPRFEPAALLALARTALPLGVVALLLSLNAYAPQWAIRRAEGDAALGVFAAILAAAMASGMLVGAAGMSASPRLAALHASGQVRHFRALHRTLLALAGGVGILTLAGAAWLGRPALRLVYGSGYADHADLLVLLCAVAALIHLVSVQGYAVTAARRFHDQVPVAVLVGFVTVPLAFALVPALGWTGAALAMLAGALVQGIGYSVLLRRALRELDAAAVEARA